MGNTQIEQALFGYDDGHRLLQASTRLNPSERDLLLQLSDLAPGVARLREDGYWTGIALPEADRYALLRTWPAPEMSRPGCVWTHALLIPLEIIRSRENLQSIRVYFRRPESIAQLEGYTDKISVQDHETQLDFPPLSRLEQVVSCIYFSECRTSHEVSQEQLGAQSLAIWNQQPSELRTRFSFRTIEKKSAGRSWLLNFDMMLLDGVLRLQREVSQPPLLSLPDKSEAALGLIKDLQHPSSEFATFRDHYGKDLPLHPVWTAFLMAAWLRVRRVRLQGSPSAYEALLDEVGASLPNSAEGLCLKAALVDFSTSSAFDFPSRYLLAALIYQAFGLNGRAYPDPNISDSSIDWLWFEEKEHFVHFLDEARKKQSSLNADLLRRLAEKIDADQLFPALQEYPDLLRSFVKIRPDYLHWTRLSTLPGYEVSRLLGTLSDEEVQSLDIVPTLITTRDDELAAFLCSRYASEVVFAVCASSSRFSGLTQPHDLILSFVGNKASEFLTGAFVSRLRTTNALLAFASMLGFVNAATVSAGPSIWAEPLHRAVMNSAENDLYKLQAFSLALGLATACPGSEALLSFGFENIHQAVKDSRLDYQASVMLEPLLPDMAWWKRWDSCHRLRIAIINAYAYGDIPLNSFAKLAQSPSMMGLLWHEIESHGEYRHLLDRLRAAIS